MTNRARALVCAAAALTAIWIPLYGRSRDTPLEAAALAWDRGDYIAALNEYLQILDGPGADAAFETIALQTGELFQTTELTTDGDQPKFSPDGRHLLYETGPVAARRIRLAMVSDPTKAIAELNGARGVFSPDGARLAYLKLAPGEALEQAQAAADAAAPPERTQRTAALNSLIGVQSRLVIRELASGREVEIDTRRLRKTGLAYFASGVLVAGSQGDGSAVQIYTVSEAASLAALTTGDSDKTIGEANTTGTALIFTARAPAGAAGAVGAAGGRGGAGGGAGAPLTFGLLTYPFTTPAILTGTAPSFSPDGNTLLYIARDADEYRLLAAEVRDTSKLTVVRKGPERLDAPAASPDGRKLAFQVMPKEDWEIFTVNRDGTGETRVTREIQHDVLPRFIGNDRLVGMIGEARHRRSQVYDLAGTTRTRIFHNNTIRTISPEYAWVPSPDGSRVLITAERDGDTVSPERGVYLVNLERPISREHLRARLRANLASETALRAQGLRLYAPISAAVRTVTDQASVARVFSYEKALFDFDSKHITRPGNKRASEYLSNKYKSFGYEPAYQWFAGRGALGGQTANVIATLKGTVNPELVYVVSSHYDSVAIGPGADDDTSGTAALLETARIMAKTPQPATIVFASFTGEEAGLLGSREYVRRAVADKVHIVGALNNDMVGWANDHRLDNTIRYSNAGIRDVQHAAAMQFSSMVLYDALYYKSTDAAAYYEAYGDIVGGIGSYPVLGNPHYHQSHDLLDTINHQLVTEVAKTTAATLMLLASSPSRLKDLSIDRSAGGSARVSWKASPENGVTAYIVAYGPRSNPEAQQMRVTTTSATIPRIEAGSVVSVKAVNARGLEGWDWARVSVK
ncbi:MAG: M20/M25/M40 family metallo-hydrolase [Vicinamibacterales bacterium]